MFGMNDKTNVDGSNIEATSLDNTTLKTTHLETVEDKTIDNTVIQQNNSSVDNKSDDKSDDNIIEKSDDKSNIDNHNYESGTVIEYDGNEYTINDNGDLVDKDNNIFKEAKDIKSFIEENKISDDKELSIDSIKDSIGIDILDEDDKQIEFENTPDGIKSYIESVIDLKKEEIQESTINSLYDRYPIIEKVLDYYVANGESLDGFGEMPDRRTITINENDKDQHKAIIKESFKQFNKKGDVDNYIKYLENSGTLYDIAKEELEALKEYDKEQETQIRSKAEEAEQKRIEQESEYWNKIKETINSKKLGNYTIPDNIIINKNGKKVSVTSDDFWDYIYQVDENNMSRYDKDREKVKEEDLIHEDLIKAWLTFTGGTYNDLIAMAINEEKTKRIKVASKTANTRGTIKIVKPTIKKDNIGNLGFYE